MILHISEIITILVTPSPSFDSGYTNLKKPTRPQLLCPKKRGVLFVLKMRINMSVHMTN